MYIITWDVSLRTGMSITLQRNSDSVGERKGDKRQPGAVERRRHTIQQNQLISKVKFLNGPKSANRTTKQMRFNMKPKKQSPNKRALTKSGFYSIPPSARQWCFITGSQQVNFQLWLQRQYSFFFLFSCPGRSYTIHPALSAPHPQIRQTDTHIY
jgi:hypothetical protein